jgi:uncharacterized protein YbgA (DUF1722 family)/uncharacterized protein YbbK (DUF523 family)
VRFDGGHKRDAFLTDVLDRFVTWVPVCPESEAGFGTPRESMRLTTRGGSIHLLTVRSQRDLTHEFQAYTARRVPLLAAQDLDGFVLKKDSPSCGVMRVKVYGDNGTIVRSGRGLFAEALTRTLPLLPVEEEGRLADAGIREHFVERVFAHQRLRQLAAPATRTHDLMDFHARHKLLLLAHSPRLYASLGQVVANADRAPLAHALDRYRSAFMTALAAPATRGRHANVLKHMAGYFRDVLRPDARRELAESITEYHRGLVPLVVPVTLLAHYAKIEGIQYLLDQVYLEPHPKELKLRNYG